MSNNNTRRRKAKKARKQYTPLLDRLCVSAVVDIVQKNPEYPKLRHELLAASITRTEKSFSAWIRRAFSTKESHGHRKEDR